MEYFWILYYLIIIGLAVFIIISIWNASDKQEAKSLYKQENLQTGDLVFVRYDNSLGYFMRLWSGSPWTHMGMVFRDVTNQVYIMETANYHATSKLQERKGLLVLPISEWLQRNRNCQISVKPLKTPKDFDRRNLYRSFVRIDGKKLDTFGINWFRLLGKRSYHSLKSQENVMCYELIVYLLQENEVIEKEYSASSYFPGNIIDNELKLRPGFKFEDIYMLK